MVGSLVMEAGEQVGPAPCLLHHLGEQALHCLGSTVGLALNVGVTSY